MRDGGRIAAALAVVEETLGRGRPVRLALKGWGEGARYAGAKDRAFVSGLVMDVLRRRRSLAWSMGDDSPRAACFAALRLVWGWDAARIAAAAAEAHGPGPLGEVDVARLGAPRDLAQAPAPVRGDYADWMAPMLERVFAGSCVEELEALAQRAPLDLRVNFLRADVPRVLKALAPFGAAPVEGVAAAVRISAPGASERAPAVEAIPEFEKGWFEVQDLGSQIAAAAAGEIAGQQVLDYCAGGGGKTLAMAAAMANTGQIFAYDADARRLTDTVRRARRAGVRNLQVRSPVQPEPLAGLEGRMDLVFVDAPCTGSGVWRRQPDAKWRLRPEQLSRRIVEQDAVLDGAAAFARPGGRLVYVTCSLFAEENEDRVAGFLERRPEFRLSPQVGPEPLVSPLMPGVRRLTPRSAGTDGFFIAVLEKAR
jgi:16S rRNA (cytosine967-C5)-methyltransferase